jgi:predicted permease
MDGSRRNDPIFAEDHVYAENKLPPIRRFKFVAPGFFATMGNPLKAGRDISWTEIYDKRPVVLLAENLAKELWGTPQAAIGKRVRQSPKDPWFEVIGVVGDEREDGLDRKVPSLVYWPVLIKYGERVEARRSVVFSIRSPRTGTDAFLTQVRQAVWAANPALPLANVRTLETIFQRSMARTSFTLVMLTIAGAMALLLGVIGIYGVLSYAVSQRTREIGIRVALGAQHSQVRAMFVRKGLALSAIGVVIGIAAAAAVTRFMAKLLYGVNALDPATYLTVALGLIAAASLASYVPARRATSVDPVDALRAE